MDPTIVRTWRNQHPFYTPAMAWSLKTIETTQMNILFRDIVKLLLILSKRMVFCGSRFQMNILFRDIVKLLLILSKRMVFCGSRFIYVMNVLFLWDKIKTTQSPNAIIKTDNHLWDRFYFRGIIDRSFVGFTNWNSRDQNGSCEQK